ncbi:MAG TPA: Holliday junction branch migration protein RuvA [Flavobacteriaceae bacterium]|nr:Holliday junction branch migration protein RuvA [Flavobacteriaceae bacterium]
MIAHLRGKLVHKSPTSIVIECGGVGYEVNISLHSYASLPTDENIFIHTYFHVKEDIQSLYGFMGEFEREVFKKLITVSGVGTSTARTMLSSLTPEETVQAITSEDVEVLKSVKGIGVKTAQRLIIDLKDKFSDLGETSKILTTLNNTQKEEALSALETLGYKRKQSSRVVRNILLENKNATAETIIKLALKKL